MREYIRLGKASQSECEDAGRMIHLEWSGPFSLDAIQRLNGISDKGLYQVYAHHPVYGRCLVYIGKTDDTFARRIPEHNFERGSENDPERVEYYVGRLKGETTPDTSQWSEEIGLAETLLIHAHAPAYNSTEMMCVSNEKAVANVRVLNSGAVRSLHREVSGLMWASIPELNLQLYGLAPTGTATR